VAEFRAILDRLQPDVIFAEIPSANLADYLDGSHGNLESAAVVPYRERRPVNVVPVDLKRPSDEFFRDSEEMFKKVERTSHDYRRLMDQNSLDTRDHGFLTSTAIAAPKHGQTSMARCLQQSNGSATPGCDKSTISGARQTTVARREC
jgi:hypothetical protein